MKGSQFDDWDWLFAVLFMMLLLLAVTVAANISFLRYIELCFSGSCATAIPTR